MASVQDIDEISLVAAMSKSLATKTKRLMVVPVGSGREISLLRNEMKQSSYHVWVFQTTGSIKHRPAYNARHHAA